MVSVIPYRVMRILLGSVFIVSGLSKSTDLLFFTQVVQAFAILPQGFEGPAAVIIVLAELVLGTGLVFDLRFSLGGILAMLLGFMAVIIYALYMGYDIDCGCFGPGDPEAEAFQGLYTALARDFVLLAVCFYLYLCRYKNRWQPFYPNRMVSEFKKIKVKISGENV